MKLPKLPTQPSSTIATLTSAGFQCYAVGGCVRDLLMDKPTHDWDFTTNATPDEILKLFPDNSFYENDFGTVGIKIPDTEHIEDLPAGRQEIYEITSYRTETGYSDRRHPDEIVWGASLEEDLKRRDFTINAIAYDGTTIVDPHNGMEDIKNKTVRAVGDPHKRFEEDALRLLRAVRIATQLGFSIEQQTHAALKTHAALLENVSQERIRDEFMKLMRSDNPADGIMLLKETGILYIILPEFEEAFATEQKSPQRHHVYDVGTHLVESLRNCLSEDPIVRLATLLHDIGKPATFEKTAEGITTFYNHEIIGASIARNIASRLRLSKKDAGKLVRLVRWHQFSVTEEQTDKAVRRFIRKLGIDLIEDMLELRRADRLGGGASETSWRTELFKKRVIEVQKLPFTVKDLKINGHDIMTVCNEGPGPHIGKILNDLFSEVEDGKLENEKEKLIERVQALKK